MPSTVRHASSSVDGMAVPQVEDLSGGPRNPATSASVRLAGFTSGRRADRLDTVLALADDVDVGLCMQDNLQDVMNSVLVNNAALDLDTTPPGPHR